MPVIVKWMDSDQTLLMLESLGQVTRAAYQYAAEAMIAMIESARERVDVIIVQRADCTVCDEDIADAAHRTMVLPENCGLMVFVREAVRRKSARPAFVQRWQDRFAIAPDLKTAVELISAERGPIPIAS